jgi:hypothetical protein
MMVVRAYYPAMTPDEGEIFIVVVDSEESLKEAFSRVDKRCGRLGLRRLGSSVVYQLVDAVYLHHIKSVSDAVTKVLKRRSRTLSRPKLFTPLRPRRRPATFTR